MRRCILQLAMALATLYFDGCCTARPTTEPATQPRPAVVAEFTLDRWGGPIYVPVTWAGKPAWFILDTGASICLVDTAAFADLKPTDDEVAAHTTGGRADFRLFYPPQLRVGPIELSHCGPVVKLDFADIRAAVDRPVIGILGVSAIDDCVLQIDFDHRRARLLAADRSPHPEWGPQWPLLMVGDIPQPAMRLSIGGLDQEVDIDTGGIDTAVALPTASFDQLCGRRPTRHFLAMTANGVARLRGARLPAIDLAGRRYADLMCDETHADRASLGMDFFDRNVVTIDFPGHHLYVRPGTCADHLTEEDLSGIRCARAGVELVARSVEEGSPAAQAGLKPGDVLVELDGKPAAACSVREVTDLLGSRDGRVVQMTIRRGDATVRVTITLHRVT